MSLSGSKPCFKSVILLAAVFLLVGMAPPAMAQTASQGTLTGQITDQQGAVIPGVQVKLVDPSTNSTREATTNENGRYTIPNVQPGTYNVTVTKQGFTTAKLTGQVIEVGQVLTLDVPMAVGAGANVLVAGSSVFGANKTVTAAIEALREAAIQAAP